MIPPKTTYQHVLDYVQPPATISGYPHLRSLLADPACLSLIELEVFLKLPPLLDALDHIPGDVLSAGVWRGGFALALQTLIHQSPVERNLLLADTFEGFPERESRFEKDQEAKKRFNPLLQAHFPTPQQVLGHFTFLALPTENVQFLIGDVGNTLTAVEHPLALVHIDLDLYEPTLATLQLTYELLQSGGLIVIDDYGAPVFGCREAVEEFRKAKNITSDLHYLSKYCVYWYK